MRNKHIVLPVLVTVFALCSCGGGGGGGNDRNRQVYVGIAWDDNVDLDLRVPDGDQCTPCSYSNRSWCDHAGDDRGTDGEDIHSEAIGFRTRPGHEPYRAMVKNLSSYERVFAGLVVFDDPENEPARQGTWSVPGGAEGYFAVIDHNGTRQAVFMEKRRSGEYRVLPELENAANQNVLRVAIQSRLQAIKR